jgi:hypothetical protein
MYYLLNSLYGSCSWTSIAIQRHRQLYHIRHGWSFLVAPQILQQREGTFCNLQVWLHQNDKYNGFPPYTDIKVATTPISFAVATISAVCAICVILDLQQLVQTKIPLQDFIYLFTFPFFPTWIILELTKLFFSELIIRLLSRGLYIWSLLISTSDFSNERVAENVGPKTRAPRKKLVAS